MANEGLGVTSAIFSAVALGTSYETPVVLTPKGANRLVLTVDISAGDATTIEVRVRARRDGTGDFINRGPEQSFATGAAQGFATGVLGQRIVIDNINSSERELDVTFKRTGGAAATGAMGARFNRVAVPLATA